MSAPTLFLGLDEVGRGCLAGPVVAAAFARTGSFRKEIIPPSLELISDGVSPAENARTDFRPARWKLSQLGLSGLTDSKKLTSDARERLTFRLRELVDENEFFLGVGSCSAQEIDVWNIRVASFLAMLRAVGAMAGLSSLDLSEIRPVPFSQQRDVFQNAVHKWSQNFSRVVVLIDGRDLLGGWFPRSWRQLAVIGGDGLIHEISAASVVAKVCRDDWMALHHAVDPRFGFVSHKGYSCPEHIQALRAHGPSSHHRMTFRPCRGDDDAVVQTLQS